MKSVISLSLLFSVLLSSCMFGGKRVKGDGNIKTEHRNVNPFEEVQVSGAISLFLSQGEFKPVQLESDQNLLQYIELVQQGDRLEIRTRSGFNLDPTNEIKVYLTAPQYRKVDVSGACNITSATKLVSDNDLEVEMSGASKMVLDVDLPQIKTSLSGSGEINLKGETKKLIIEMSGAAEAHCFELLSEETSVNISGAGSADVYASQKLDVDVSGAGNVKYKGEVKNITQKVSGAGGVEKAD